MLIRYCNALPIDRPTNSTTENAEYMAAVKPGNVRKNATKTGEKPLATPLVTAIYPKRLRKPRSFFKYCTASRMSSTLAQETIDYTDKIYLEFGADPHIEGLGNKEEVKNIRRRAIKAGLRLVD